tara:strand:+ start:3155 stop:8764 length:5610 start_codon:yes stop_codon:yes gene_type:complete
MAILSAISFLANLNPTSDVNGTVTARNPFPASPSDNQPPGHFSQSRGFGDKTVVRVVFTVSRQVGITDPNGDYFPDSPVIDYIQDITQDGFASANQYSPSNYVATDPPNSPLPAQSPATGGNPISTNVPCWNQTGGVAAGSKMAIDYCDDGEWYQTGTPHSSYFAGGIPDTSKERLYEVWFTNGTKVRISVFVMGRNALQHKGHDITNVAIDNLQPDFFGGINQINPNNKEQSKTTKAVNLHPSVSTTSGGDTNYINVHEDPNNPVTGWPANAQAVPSVGIFNSDFFIPKLNHTYQIEHSSLLYHPNNWLETMYGTKVKRTAFAAKIEKDDDARYAGLSGIPLTVDINLDIIDVTNNPGGGPDNESIVLGSDRPYAAWAQASGNWNPSAISGLPTNGTPTGNLSADLNANYVDHQGENLANYSYFGVPESPMNINPNLTNSAGNTSTMQNSLHTSVKEILVDAESWVTNSLGNVNTPISSGGSGISYDDVVNFYTNIDPTNTGNGDFAPAVGYSYVWTPGENPCDDGPNILPQHVTVTDDTTGVVGSGPGGGGIGGNGAVSIDFALIGGVNPVDIELHVGSVGSNNYIGVQGAGGSGAGNTGSAHSMTAGTYCYVATDVNGCQSTYCFTVNGPVIPTCNIQATLSESVGCSGIATLTINTNQPTSTWNIEWYDPNGSIIPTSSSNQLTLQVSAANLPGVYSVHIEDTSFAPGTCTSTLNFASISSTTSISLAATSTDVTVYGGNDGTATALVSGGTAPYVYSWSNGASTQTTTGLSVGTYSVTVTDAQGCTSQTNVVVSQPTSHPLNSKCLKVCLDLDEGVFDFVDENNYSPSGVQLPYRIALTIEHSNGTIVYPGSLANPDIFSDADLSNLRTYDYNIKYGQNNSIPIPTSGGNYISDVYKVTTQWSFSGNSVADVTKVCYINAQGLAMFDNLQIDTELTYSCTGDLISKDNTVYGMTGIPFTISRTHKLFAPATANLPNPAFSTGSNMITHDLYEGQWSNFIETFVTWTVPSMPALGITYEPLCVKKTMYGTANADVECFVDPCVVQHYSKKIKNRYDQAVCDCDTLKIKKYRAQLQRIVELLNVYIIGDKSDCVNDYSELWTILGITYQDHLTDPNCCSTPDINPNMIGDGCIDGPCGDDGGGGDPPPPPPDPDPCLCDENTPYWTQSNQSAGTYAVGDLVIYSTGGPGSLENPGSCVACFQVGNIPSGGWDASVPLDETPNNDSSAYWTFVDCSGTSGNPDCYGCTDSTASNYDPTAVYDDGSCTTCIYGCTDSTALNYDPNATCNDGTCIAILMGCTDPKACNYYPGAHVDDGSCCYTSGCFDPLASNYDPNACCPGECIYGSGCSTTDWTSVHDLIYANNTLSESIPRYSILDIDTGAGSSGDKNLMILGKTKVSYSKINNSGNVLYSHGDLANIQAPDDYYSYYNNPSGGGQYNGCSNFVKDGDDRYWVVDWIFLRLLQRSPGHQTASVDNSFENNSSGTAMSNPFYYTNYALPALIDGKEMRYTTMDIDGTGTLHILFGSKDSSDDVVDTSPASGSYKTYYYTVNTSTGVFTLVDTLNESSADCHLYWRNENSNDLAQYNAGDGYEKGEWNAVLKVDSSNKPWVASNGKLMKYDSGWKNIAGAAATANAGDFYTHPTNGANTVFSVDSAGATKNPGGSNTGHKWTYRDVVLDFVIDGSNKYILTYSTRKLVNAIGDGLVKDISRKGEVILHIHDGSSWSHLPVPSQRDVNGSSLTEHYFDNYTSFPDLVFKPTVIIRSGVPYVHLLCNDYDGSDWGLTNVSWVWKYESSTWTQVSTDVYSNVNGCGLDDLGSLQLSTVCQPLTGMVYDSAADELYVIYSEIAEAIHGGIPHGKAGIKKICF